MENQSKTRYTVKRIEGRLHMITPIVDGAGKVLQHVVTPLMVELRRRDIMQIIVGASVLAIPVGFTEETWNLGERLPLANVLALTIISILFIAAFVYFNFYRNHLRGYVLEYVKRVIAIYILALIVVGVLLAIIDKTPWGTDGALAVKRIIIVAFPASMSAAISDSIK